jgi:hypothetical protein
MDQRGFWKRLTPDLQDMLSRPASSRSPTGVADIRSMLLLNPYHGDALTIDCRQINKRLQNMVTDVEIWEKLLGSLALPLASNFIDMALTRARLSCFQGNDPE